MKRLGIYSFFEKDGIVDEYVLFQLNEVSTFLDELVIIVRGKLSVLGRENLTKITRNVMVVDNITNQIEAFQRGFDFVKGEEIQGYQEVILFDNSFIGPFTSLEPLFEKMQGDPCDFWGITKSTKKIDKEVKQEYLDNYFLVLRESLFNSYEFKEFLQIVLDKKSNKLLKNDQITTYFSDKGFSWNCAIDMDELLEISDHPLLELPNILLSKHLCPVMLIASLKRQYSEILNSSVGETVMDSIHFIRKTYKYNLSLIYSYLLRTTNMELIKNLLHLNYILSDSTISEPKGNADSVLSTALFAHIFYKDQVSYLYDYIAAIPDQMDVYISYVDDEIRQECENIFNSKLSKKAIYIPVKNRGRDVSALLIGMREMVEKYELICFIHDKKSSGVLPATSGKSWGYECYQNMIGNQIYIKNVISLFESNPQLGIAFPPPPIHGSYFDYDYWTINYENTVKWAEKLNITAPIERRQNPIAPLGTMFWFRPDALKTLFDYQWKYEDFPKEPNKLDGTLLHAIERLYGFAAQSRNYFACWIINSSYAAIEISNLRSRLDQVKYGKSLGIMYRIEKKIKSKLRKHPYLYETMRKFKRVLIKHNVEVTMD